MNHLTPISLQYPPMVSVVEPRFVFSADFPVPGLRNQRVKLDWDDAFTANTAIESVGRGYRARIPADIKIGMEVVFEKDTVAGRFEELTENRAVQATRRGENAGQPIVVTYRQSPLLLTPSSPAKTLGFRPKLENPLLDQGPRPGVQQ